MALAIPGPQGSQGDPGVNGTNGVNAFTVLTATFVMPSSGASAIATVGDSSWIGINQNLYLEAAGYMQALSRPSSTQVELKNLGYTGNVSAATAIPVGSHISPAGHVGADGSLTGAAGGDLTGSYPNPQIAPGVITAAEIAAANIDGAAGVASMRTLGTGAAQAAPGNDSRFTNSRAPTGAAGGDLTGAYPNPTLGLSGVIANTYGGPSAIPRITVDAKGRITAVLDQVPTALPYSGRLATIESANFNVTTDQLLPILVARYIIRRITVENASISLTTAAGGIYTAISKGGTAIVAAAQVYSALTASNKYLDLTLANNDVRTEASLYFSLTTAQGAPATARITIWGDQMNL